MYLDPHYWSKNIDIPTNIILSYVDLWPTIITDEIFLQYLLHIPYSFIITDHLQYIHLLEMSTITQLVRYRTFDIEMFLFYYSLEVVLEMRLRHFPLEILHDCLFFVRKLVTKKNWSFFFLRKETKSNSKMKKSFLYPKNHKKNFYLFIFVKKAWRWNFLQSKPQQIKN